MSAERGRRRRRCSGRHGRGAGFALVALLALLWQVSATQGAASPNWPPPSEVLRALASGLASGELALVFGSTLARAAAGFAAGAAAGIVLGSAIALSPRVAAALAPTLELLRPLPVPALVPPLVLLVGIDDAMKVSLVAYSTGFPVLVNTVAGLRAVDRIWLDVGRTFGVGRLRTLVQVRLPAALPYLLAGLRTSLALALVVTVVAEMLAGASGVGYHLTTMQYAMRGAETYAAIVGLAAVGYALNGAFGALETRLLRGHRHEPRG